MNFYFVGDEIELIGLLSMEKMTMRSKYLMISMSFPCKNSLRQLFLFGCIACVRNMLYQHLWLLQKSENSDFMVLLTESFLLTRG